MNDSNLPQSHTNINNIETHMITIIIKLVEFHLIRISQSVDSRVLHMQLFIYVYS